MTRSKRNRFAELLEGVDALAAGRVGKVTLRQVDVTAAELIALRQRHNVSSTVMAARLRTHPRTLEHWEHGRAKPNAQAALLIKLVERYPETMEHLANV